MSSSGACTSSGKGSKKRQIQVRCVCFKCTQGGLCPKGVSVSLRTWREHRAADIRTLKLLKEIHGAKHTPHKALLTSLASQPTEDGAANPTIEVESQQEDVLMGDPDYLLDMLSSHHPRSPSSPARSTSYASTLLHSLEFPAPPSPAPAPPHQHIPQPDDSAEPARMGAGQTETSRQDADSGASVGGHSGDGAVEVHGAGATDSWDSEDGEDDMNEPDDTDGADSTGEASSGEDTDGGSDNEDPSGGSTEGASDRGTDFRLGPELLAELVGKYTAGPTPTHRERVPKLSPTENLSLRHYRRWLRTHGTVEAYEEHANTLRELKHEILSLHAIKKLASRITGLHPQPFDMCVNSCVAFVGKRANDTVCTWKRKVKDSKGVLRTVTCNEPRRDAQGNPRLQFWVLPLLDRLRALFRSATMSRLLYHRHERLDGLLSANESGDWSKHAFADSVDGIRNLKLHANGLLQEYRDIALSIATDGAQLLANKDSAAWIITASCLNTPPEIRFKRAHQFVLTVVPGPNQPGDIESFFWPIAKELAELSVGAWVWDELEGKWALIRAYLVGIYADQPGSTKVNKMKGTQGRRGCRFCMMEACYGCAPTSATKNRPATSTSSTSQPAIATNGGTGLPPQPASGLDTSAAGHARHVPATSLQQTESRPAAQSTGHSTSAPARVGKTAYFPLTTPTSLMKANPNRPESYDPAALPLRTQSLYEQQIRELKACRTKKAREETATQNGVSGVPFLSLSPAFSHPDFFPLDVFHLFSYNTLGHFWKYIVAPAAGDPLIMSADQCRDFGVAVRKAAFDLPGRFGNPPRDPYLFSNSHFKMVEWIKVWHYYLGPYLHSLHGDSPVLNMVLALLDGISVAVQDPGCTFKDIAFVNKSMRTFAQMFEALFVRGDPALLSRARISVHLLLHVGRSISTSGSLRACSQAACERTIGSIKEELRCHKELYATVRVRTHLVEQLHSLDLILDTEESGAAALMEHRQELASRIGQVVRPDAPIKLKNFTPQGVSMADIYAALAARGLSLSTAVSFYHCVTFHCLTWTFRVRARSGESSQTRRRSSRIMCVFLDEDEQSTYKFYDVFAFARPHGSNLLYAIGRPFKVDDGDDPSAVTQHWFCGQWQDELRAVPARSCVDMVGQFSPPASQSVYLFMRKNSLGGFNEWAREGVTASVKEEMA